MRKLTLHATATLVAAFAIFVVASASATRSTVSTTRRVNDSIATISTAAAQQFYVTGRYYCAANSDGASRGSCDITTSANSCSAAIDQHRADISRRGDPCVHCVANETDNTRHQTGKVDWIHGGACQGVHP